MNTPATKNISYLALGDSYTIGEGVATSERFPSQLVEELKRKNINASPEIIATTGWTTADLMRGITNAKIDGKKYNIVSLLIGVNNQYQGKSIEEYKIQFRELLLTAIEFAGSDKNKVFVLSIPDYGHTPFGKSNQAHITEQIDLFNAANKQISDSFGVKYFDITPVSQKGLNDPSLIAADGLHPSGKMYREWVELMAEDVVKIISHP